MHRVRSPACPAGRLSEGGRHAVETRASDVLSNGLGARSATRPFRKFTLPPIAASEHIPPESGSKLLNRFHPRQHVSISGVAALHHRKGIYLGIMGLKRVCIG